MVKWKVSIGAIAIAQNARIPSWPRWPLPSGSNIDGPTGSSITASSAYTVSHSLEVARGHGGVRALRGGAGGVLAVRARSR